jgi:hypothetical protein
MLMALALVLERAGLMRRVSRALGTLAGTKMLSPSSIHIVVAGSRAGKFSCVMPGFGAGTSEAMKKLSSCVTKPIRPAPRNMAENVKALARAVFGDAVAAPESDGSGENRSICDPRGQCTMPQMVQAPRSNISIMQGTSGGAGAGVLGLLDISKPGGSMFFDRLAVLMKARGVTRIKRYQKPTFSRQCPMDLRRRIARECDAVVLSLAD